MARIPVQRMDQDILLRPVASPSETFVKPPAQVDAGANLRDLAQGLAKFDAGLNSYFEQEAERKSKEDALLAEADFHKNNGKGFAQGVADGTIPSFASKAYMDTYKGLEGQQAGRVLEQKFWADYDKWEGKNSQDPNAFQNFYNGWLKENISDTQDPKILAGLLLRLRGLTENATNKWVADKDKATKQGMSDAAGAAAGNAIKDARTSALAGGKSIDYDGTFTKLDTLRTTLGSNGRTDAENDRTMIDSVTAMAIEQRDPRWLGYLDRKIPGKDYSLADTPYGRDVKQKTVDALEVIHRRGVTEARQAQTEMDKKTKEAATKDAINFMLENPGKPVPEDVLARGEKVDGSFRKDVLQWGEQLRSAKKSANTEAVAEVNRAIINGGGMRAFRGAMDHGVFAGDPEGMRAAYKLAEDVDKVGVVFGDIMKSSAATSIMGTINKRTQEKDDPGAVFAPEGISDVGRAAQYDFKAMVLRWARENPELAKDPIKSAEAVERIGKLVTDRLGRGEDGAKDGIGPPRYDRRGMEKLAGESPWYPAKEAPTATPTGPTAPIKAQDPQAAVGQQSQAQQPQAQQPQEPPFTDGAITKNPDGSSTRQFIGGDGVKYVQKLDPKLGWQQPQPWTPPDVNIPVSPGNAPAPQGSQGARVPGGTPAPGQAPGGASTPQAPGAASATPLTDALQGTDASRIAREGIAEAGRIASDAAVAPKQFIEWLQGGGAQPPANQPSGIGVLMKSIGVENPEGFMSWLGKNLGIGGAQAAEAPQQQQAPTTPGQLTSDGSTPAASADTISTSPAARTGVVLEPVTWKPGQFNEDDAPNPELAKAVSSAIQDAIKNASYKPKGVFTLATLKNDPVANRLLDFVSGPESNGNYNAVWGKANSKVDLSQFSVGEILARQAATIRSGGQSATGRYQFIRRTLAGLVDEMNIPLDTKFTPELQDQMALHLLNRRGLEKYRSGQISIEQFGNNLAQEWASLPNLTTYTTKDGKVRREGASAYAGDGLNKSHVSTQAVRDVLNLGDDAGATAPRRTRKKT